MMRPLLLSCKFRCLDSRLYLSWLGMCRHFAVQSSCPPPLLLELAYTQAALQEQSSRNLPHLLLLTLLVARRRAVQQAVSDPADSRELRIFLTEVPLIGCLDNGRLPHTKTCDKMARDSMRGCSKDNGDRNQDAAVTGALYFERKNRMRFSGVAIAS